MRRKCYKKLLFFAVFFVLFTFLAQSALASDKITVDFFYSSNCGSCNAKFPIINATIEKYQDRITVYWKNIYKNNTNLHEYEAISKNYSAAYPFVFIKSNSNSTLLTRYNITLLDISRVIDAYLNGTAINETWGTDLIVIDIFGYRMTVNASSLSLPILTVVLGGLDSFNPCAFFILIFLLNLMIYAHSRKRMALIGGIFIFFSGLWYYLFMFVLYNTLLVAGGFFDILTVILGCIVFVLGAINIKDFFFFKKGVSLSIPDEKKSGLFKKMRDLVKNPEVAAVIFGTIVLAATVNFYELLCTSGFPLVFTNQLRAYNMSTSDSYLYIFFYNVVYVIPLIVIVLIFVLTLGRWKLSEWHGRVLKLLSGIMLASFGGLFIVDFIFNANILHNVVTPILLLVFSVLATLVVSSLWKKYSNKK